MEFKILGNMSLIIRDFAFLENKLITNAADTDWNSRCKSSLDQVKCQCEALGLIQLFSVCGVRLMQSSCPLFHKKRKKSKTKQDTSTILSLLLLSDESCWMVGGRLTFVFGSQGMLEC